MFNKQSSGFTLVEMIIAIVIIGVGLAGVLLAFNTTVKSSADPMIRKQMLAVAEEMLEEILLKPYTDPEGDAAPFNTVAACDTAGAVRSAFDDVSDYLNYQTTGICDIDGATVAGLATYGVQVVIDTTASLGGLSGAAVAKRVTVNVAHGSETISLVGWRTNYAAP